MNEMDLLERVRADVEIDPTALLRARRRLLRRAVAPAVRRRRTARRMVTAAAVAAALAALAVVALPGPQGAEPAAAAVLSRAARLAAVEDAPAPGQWLYVRLETTRGGGTAASTSLQERWVPGDDSRAQVFLDGGDRWTRPVDRPAIYTDAGASAADLYAWLTRDNGDLRGDDAAFERAAEVMFDSTAPPAFKARLLEAIALISDVRVVDEGRTLHGRPVVAVGREDMGGETRFLFDSRTGKLLGVEGVAPVPSAHYTTLFASRVVDRLPDRAAS